MIGFCCKLVVPHTTKIFESVESANNKTTTATWIRKHKGAGADDKLEAIIRHNLQALSHLLRYVAKLPHLQRMVRISSDVLPLYTHADAKPFYKNHQQFMSRVVEPSLFRVGEFARENNIRLSFHPGQFCVLGSDRPEVVASSIEELEYHAVLAKMMGYCKSFQDFKINVHLSGKAGAVGFRKAFGQLSPELRSCLTIENDEFQAGINDVLQVADLVPIVLDIHHHFIHCGEYIAATDSRIKQVQDSWRGVRPVIHYAQCAERFLLPKFADSLPSLADLVAIAPRKDLRAHSAFFNHTPTNGWAKQHLSWADIQLECKAKNLASEKLAAEWQQA